MNITPTMPESVLAQSQLCQKQGTQVIVWLLALLLFIGVVVCVHDMALAPANLPAKFIYIAIILGMPVAAVLAINVWRYMGSRSYLSDYEKIRSELASACVASSVASIQRVISKASAVAEYNHLLPPLLEHYQPILRNRMTELHRRSLTLELQKEYAALESSCEIKIQKTLDEQPAIKARSHLASSLNFLAKRRKEMTDQWEEAYENFSWWNKIKYSDGPDFSDIDKAISDLRVLQHKLDYERSDHFEALDEHFEKLERQALSRLSAAKIEAASHIQNSSYDDSVNSGLLKKGLWFSAISVPVSMWFDLDSAGNVYDTLRGVNENFATMSDAEIWWESLFLPAESLAGLAALTKGAYFERLVADDTGGQLFEHFNNPDTDIVIDGIAFQLKATDSAAYVLSVDESIPVITTTEAALATGAIDSGYSHEALTNTVDNALGGTVVDIGDTAADAILAGLGGLGFFATLEGINHASKKYENGGDAVEAVFEGAGVAIEGTARALVGAAEMGYNILASRPSRFVGRVLLSGVKKLDDKMMAAAEKK